ncbi:MAG: GIY-YIG nuclease family protein [Rubrobacter sp.]|nr:GIY-YIG nuclease family protein [Rubrobacter sp.]
MKRETLGKTGYVCILINPTFPSYVKIGKTTKDPEVRARELSSGTGIPAPYGVAWDVFVSNCGEVERLVHQRLAHARARNDREFFAIPLRRAVSVLTEIAMPFECDPELTYQAVGSEADDELSTTQLAFSHSDCQMVSHHGTRVSTSAREELIEIAADSHVIRSEEPPYGGTGKTIARVSYEVLAENPYVFSEPEFYHEVHVIRRKRPDLRIESYNIKKLALVKNFGWGIHRNKDGKLALVPCESERYKELLADQLVKKTKAYRNRSSTRTE